MPSADFWTSLSKMTPSSRPLEAVGVPAPEEEGQLAVDVAQTDRDIIVTSTIAGARPEDIEISIAGDLLTIRGTRKNELELKDDDYFYRECYWGSFSRTIVLPTDVLTDDAQALLKNGVLMIRIPKESPKKKVAIKFEE